MAYERKSVNECLASTLKCLNLEKSLFIPEIKDFTEEEIAKLIKEHRYFNYEDFLILLDNKLQELTDEDFEINVRAIPLSLDDGSSGLNVIM